jgi:hypothetical protein
MVWLCTKTAQTVVPTYPHQEFFGISDTHFDDYFKTSSAVNRGLEWPALMELVKASRGRSERIATKKDEIPFGQIPFDVFLNCKNPVPQIPSAMDISQVSAILHTKGLPPELVLQVMRHSGYDTVQRRLPIAHDPLHPENREAFKKYLTFCWLTLVRCNMLAQALGIEINWKLEIIECLARILGVPPGRRLYTEEYDDEEDRWTYQFRDAHG